MIYDLVVDVSARGLVSKTNEKDKRKKSRMLGDKSDYTYTFYVKYWKYKWI